MRVCVVALGGGSGGMTHYTSQLSNALSKAGADVYVLFPENTNTSHFGENITFLYTPLIKRYLSFNSFRVDKLIMNVLKAKPDIIHITMSHPWLIPYLLLFKNKYPVVATIHDVKKHFGDWGPFLWTTSLQMLKKDSNKLIVHGNLLKKQLILEGVLENKIVVIPHGDYSFFLKYTDNSIKEENTILFFGRIVDYKGLEYLIKAEPTVTKQFPDIKIVIAGEGNFSKYEKLIENKKNFEIFNEFIPDKNVAELFQKSKIVVLPYIEASQSGIIPIAYAFKKAVIVTGVGSIPEVVEDGVTGLIVPPRDSVALADAIIKILEDNDLRNRMGKNAYKKMEEELSWDKIAKKTIEVYRDTINEYRGD